MSGTLETDQTTDDELDDKTKDGGTQGNDLGAEVDDKTKDGDSNEEDEGEDGDKEPEAEKQPSWAKKRISALTKEKWDERRKSRELETARDTLSAENRALKELLAEKDKANPEQQLTSQQIEERAETLANQKADVIAFNQACDGIYRVGTSAYKDFGDVLKNYQDIGGLKPALVRAALATDNPAKALYELAKDRDKADEVTRLAQSDLLKAGVVMAKYADKAVKTISTAPAPITPTRGRQASAEVDMEKVDMKDFIKGREKHLESTKRR